MVFFTFIQILIEKVETDQTLHSAASNLGLHCLPMSDKKDARFIYVN